MKLAVAMRLAADISALLLSHTAWYGDASVGSVWCKVCQSQFGYGGRVNTAT